MNGGSVVFRGTLERSKAWVPHIHWALPEGVAEAGTGSLCVNHDRYVLYRVVHSDDGRC